MSRTQIAALVASVALAAPAVPAQTDYHDQPLLYQLGRYIALRSQGYKMVSLDVAGNLDNQRWSAVWRKRALREPATTAIHGADIVKLLRWTRDRQKEGYRPKWITSAGSGLKRVYGCIMVKDGRSATIYTDISESLFHSLVEISAKTRKTPFRFGRMLTSASIHGTASNRRYAAIFADNPEQYRFGYSTNDTWSSYQKKFNVFVSKCWARPAIVTLNAGHRYLSVFTDDEIGTWTARHHMTKATYTSTRASLAKAGYTPYQIMVGGVGASARYAALFTKGPPATRRLSVRGTAVSSLSEIDRLMLGQSTRFGWINGFLQKTNAREATVAVAKDGNLIFARAYTFAKPGWPICQPTDRFRIASCTKPLTSIAIHQLAQRNRSVSMFSRLKDTVSLGTPKDARFHNIRLHHLVDHLSGWDHWHSRGVTNKLAEARNFVASKDLAFAPGTTPTGKWPYQNGGYMMLGLVLEARSGLSYLNYLRRNVFAPIGVTRPHLITTSAWSGDARCQETSWSTSRGLRAENSAMGSGLVNASYSESPLRIDATGGLVMSTVDYVRVLSGTFDTNLQSPILSATTRNQMIARMDKPGRTGGWDYMSSGKNGAGKSYKYYAKGGLWHSAHAYVIRRSDGISIAAFCSGPSAPPIQDINAALDKVTTWPTRDLFPSYGLPSFKKKTIGSARTFGLGCIGSKGRLLHTSTGTPEIGAMQRFQIQNGRPWSAAILNLGFSKRTWGRTPLPLNLNPLGATGCHVYTPPTIALAFSTGASGNISVPLTHPNNRSYVGLRFYTQFVCLDSAANPWGASYSNGVETLLGGFK